MENGKSLKEKMLFLLCLGALAGNMSTEIYGAYSNEIFNKFTYKTEGELEKVEENTTKEEIKIEGSFENDPISKDYEETVDVKKVSVDMLNTNAKINFKNDTIITSEKGYALFSNSNRDSSAGTVETIININENKNNRIQIIGDIEVCTTGYNLRNRISNSTINLNLNGEESFFAGKIKTKEEGILVTDDYDKVNINSDEFSITSNVNINLENEATWYVQCPNLADTYTIDGSREKFQKLENDSFIRKDGGITVTSNGGIIDIYNYAPGVARPESAGTREFKLNGVGDRLEKTTFRISTDIANKKSDLIKLEGVDATKDSQTYYIQIVADPTKGEWKLEPEDKIPVMNINGDGLNNVKVEGKEYPVETNAGLLKQTITPTVKEEGVGTGSWYLTGIEKVENPEGNKGSGHIFAEIGAAANAGMASAWRTDSGDLYQRMGNLRNNEAEQGVWGRIYTGENEVRKGIGLDLEYRAVQVGYDRKQNIDGGKLFTGIAFGYFDGNADYDHGSGESNSATVGMYATYSGNNGSFGDFIVKLGNIDNKLSYTSESGDYYKADYDTYGFSADAEYGYRYELNNDYYIEPLAQLSYIYIADEEYTMNLNGESGAKVSNDDYQSLIGYAGFHYGKKFGDNVAYLRVAAAHEFAGDIDVDARYQDIKVNSSISGEDTWVEYGVGFDVKVKEDTAVYGRLQKSTGDVVKNKWHASVGIRYTF